MVVAHPDDETMWGGSLPIRYPGDWTILCCSIPRRDPERAVKFKDACEVLGAEPRIIPEQEPLNMGGFHLPDGFDLVVTHGAKGEYGHRHHIQIHNLVVDYYSKYSKYSKYEVPILTFGFGKGKIKIELTEEEHAIKLLALQCYNHELPYEGKTMPKWKALLINYSGVDFGTDTFNECKSKQDI